MPNINKIKLSGTSYDIQDANATKTVELTQAQYDALVTGGTVDSNTFYIITDGEMFNPSGKVDTSAITSAVTSASTDNEIPTAKAVYDAIPTGDTGGSKAISAGTNISVTTGETADTINCKIPYSDVVYTKSDIILGKDMPSVSDYERVYYGKKIASRANGSFGYSIGIGVPPSTNSSDYNELYGSQSIGIGGFKIGNGSQYANFVSGCVAIGYGAKTRINNAVAIGKDTEASGTTKTNINNQLTIDTSNQVYIYNKDNTEMICLQDQLGGGGSSYSAGTGIDITNDVISVTGMTDVTAFTAHTADTTIHVTTAQTAAWNAKSDFSGSYNDLTDKPTIPTVPTSNTAFTNDAGYITANDITGKTDVTAFTAHTADTTIHVTTAQTAAWDAKQNALTIDSTVTSGSTNPVQGGAVYTQLGGLKLVKLTQNEYDALATKDSNTLYVING